MKKKIFKRSLALGALMAFVITGSAMATEITFNTQSELTDNWNRETNFDTSLRNKDFYYLHNESSTYPMIKAIYNKTTISGNTVTLGSGFTIGSREAFFGGNSDTGEVKNNIVNVRVNAVTDIYDIKDVRAGHSHNNAIVSNNTLNIYSGNIGAVYGGSTPNGEASYNTINIEGGTIRGIIYGGKSNVNVIGNKVIIAGGTITSTINGGSGGSTTENNSDNIVEITGGIINGQITTAGGGKKVTGNKLIISGTDGPDKKVGGVIYGGMGSELVSGNEIILSAGKYTSQIYLTAGKAPVKINNKVTILGEADLSEADIHAYGADNEATTKAHQNMLVIDSGWNGEQIKHVQKFDTIDVGKDINIIYLSGNTKNDEALTFRISDKDTTVSVNNVGNLTDKVIKLEAASEVAHQIEEQGNVNQAVQDIADNIELPTDAPKVTQVSVAEGRVNGAINATLDDTGAVTSVQKTTNKTNEALSETGTNLKAHWRTHMNDMNKRMGELRNANGEHGVWTRMVRGENEYQGAKAQYNQYQLGYDEKLSVDKRWTVGAAITFAEADGNFAKGSTEDTSTAFAFYGSKLNDDGSFIDLIARYARLESDIDMYSGDKGDYSTNGYSVSAEFGKRFTKENGFWVEPQLELTYGSIGSADFEIAGRNVHYDRMNSFITRAGFAIGKNIKQGNVYARASYLYDFDGEADTIVTAPGVTGGDPHKEDLGGGWWEVGVGANINLSKATYIYADVEKTFGGEVDTNWQWNLGVRYSF